jgi:hypothetical protein
MRGQGHISTLLPIDNKICETQLIKDMQADGLHNYQYSNTKQLGQKHPIQSYLSCTE